MDYSLYEHILLDKKVQEMLESTWRQKVGAGLLATSLLAGGLVQPSVAQPPVKVTQSEKEIDLGRLLYALKQVESSGGRDTRVRYEPGVERQLRKRYNKLGTRVKKAIDKYGYKAVATSYGPYQIMASTAYDMGYEGAPEDLKKEEVSKPFVKKYIQWLIDRGKTKTLVDVIQAYNAGLGGIGTNPHYSNKVLKYYNQR